MSWRRILLLSTALVLVSGVGLWAILENSNVATDFVRRELQRALRAPADVATTSIELAAGRLSFEGLHVDDPTEPGRRLLTVARGHVEGQADPFGDGLAPRLVVLDGVALECGPMLPTLSQLLADTGGDATGGGTPPAIELRSGTARLHLREGVEPLVVTAMQLTLTPCAAAQRRLQLRGELTLQAPAATISLVGELDLDDGSATLSVTTGGIACEAGTASHLARLAGVDPETRSIRGQLDELTMLLHLPGRDAEDRTPRVTASAQLQHVHIEAPELPPVVRSAAVKLHLDSVGGGELRAHIEQSDEGGEVSITSTIAELFSDASPKVTLRATGRGVAVTDASRQALRAFPVGRRVEAALQPKAGLADIDLYLEDPHRSGSTAELDLLLRDVEMSFHGFGDDGHRIGFPLPLEHGSGRVVLRDDVLLLRDLQADIAASVGGGKVHVEGRIETDKPGGEDTSLDIHGSDVAFGDDLRSALATLLDDEGRLYDRLAPTGRASVHVVVRPFAELDGGFAVQVDPTGAAMRWAGFPYELVDLRGSIRVRQDDARFDLTGRHGDGGLTMRGRIPLRDDHRPEDAFEAVVELDQLAIDEDLRRGIAVVVPELDAHWQRAQPSGRLSGEVKVWRPQPDDELLHDVRLTLDGVDLLLPATGWRATGLRGQVLVQGAGPSARIDFDALRGSLVHPRGAPAQLALLGHLESGQRTVRDLAFVVRDLDLSEQLGQTLDELGALGLDTWRSLRPSGRVDLVVRDRADSDAGPAGDDRQLVVQLVDVRSDAEMLPMPAEKMTGELHVEHGELTFRDVRCVLGDTPVDCTDGRVRQLPDGDGRTEITFDVHARDFPIDDGLANLFTGPLRQAVRERKLRGHADVDGLRLRFAVPTGACELPFSTTIGGTIGLLGVDMQLGTGRDGIRVENLRGLVTLADSTVDDAGGQLVGTLTRGSLSLFGHPFETIEATFTADARRLVIPDLRCRVHNGAMRNANVEVPALEYTLPAPSVPEGRLTAGLSFEDIDVFALLSATGWRNPPYSGAASGHVLLHYLEGNRVVGALADGQLTVARADLGKVPLFQAIYAQLPAAEQPRFNHLDLSFHLDENAVEFSKLEVRSELLAATGSGRLDLDGYLDVKMDLDNLLGESADPLVMPLIDALAQNLVHFRLYGHLRNLQASTEFVGQSSPRRSPVVPMPPARPRPAMPGY